MIAHPRNFAPTASEDPHCAQYIPAQGEVVDYGCAAGRVFAHLLRHARKRPLTWRDRPPVEQPEVGGGTAIFAP